MIVALVALFVALGGGAYAALKLPKGSVGAKQLKKHAVTPPKLAKSTVKKLKGATGPPGTPGQPGDTGPAGPGTKGFRSDPAATTGTAFGSLGAAGPYTLLTRCHDDGAGNIDATIAYAGPAGRLDFTSVVSPSGGAAQPSAGGGDLPEGTTAAPVPLTTGLAPTGGHSGTGSTFATIATGGQTVFVQVWAQARSAGGPQTDSCHFSALVTPVG
ncbi:MAG: hypothetical protein QOG63_31 [Thermoleophilaceae bacterium]|jgi:hypothetical protein|nr:hypothetical protein [Thermoleophilaceae bacterium]